MSQPQLQRLLDVGRALVSELDLESVLRQVLEAARDLTDAQYAAIGILDEDKATLERFLYTGIDEATRREIGPLPQGRGVLGELIRNPKPLRLADVSQHPRSYGFPASHPPMSSFVGVPVIIRGEAYGNLYLTEKAGGIEFDDKDEELLVVLARWASVAIDNARLYEGAERRRVELERAVEGLQATGSLNRELGAETDLGRILELTVKRGRALIDAGALLALRAEDDRLVVVEAAGDLSGKARGSSLPLQGSAVGQAYTRGESRRFGKAEGHTLAELGARATASLVVPLIFRGRTEGLLAALDPGGRAEFSADDELLLGSFAAAAATAIAAAESVEREKLRLSIAASEQERRRWAMELHDETLQELGALKLTHENALQRGDPELIERSVRQAVEQLEDTIASLEGLITELRPAALDELGIAAAIETLTERFERAHQLRAETEIDLAGGSGGEPDRLPAELEATVYRVVQEALNNVAKHAEATKVNVSVVEDSDHVLVTVADDGKGFEVGTTGQRFGLAGMRERVLLVGGELILDSKPGIGTRVSATLPSSRD